MNIFIFFFLTSAVVTAASTSGKHQHKNGKPGNSIHHESKKEMGIDQILLKQIINDAKTLKTILTDKILHKLEVQNVFTNETCNGKTLCEAGTVLSAYNASDLELKSERDWRLPRRLRAYSKLQNCTNTDVLESIPLGQLLDEIRTCAQQKFANY